MTEEFLHYVWQFRLYKTDLFLTTGEQVHVIHPGFHNTDSGPDFFNARIKIGDTTWSGNIEIHINSSDWFRHKHHLDKAYETVILHVVHKSGQPVFMPGGSRLPELELEGLIDQQAWTRYLQFMSARSWVPCESMISGIDPIVLYSWLDGLLIDRLQRKALQVEVVLRQSNNDWNQAFFRLLAKNMGFKLNNDAFERLASCLSYSQLSRHADNLNQLEAIIFGQAGLLNGTFSDPYPLEIQKEFDFLKKKFSLSSMDGHLWRFMRLHPGNFPTFRLSQFAHIIQHSNGLLMHLMETADIEQFQKLFSCEASAYWQNHFRFDRPAKSRSRRMGEISVNLLLINLVSPFMFVYGKRNGKKEFIVKALDILEKIKGENNAVSRAWSSLGLNVATAFDTQALLELKSNYCDQKKCLSCRIGLNLLKEAETASISKPEPLNQI